MADNVASALNNIQSLMGDLLSTVIADFTSVMQAANTWTESVLPTGGVLAVVAPHGTTAAAVGNISPPITSGLMTVGGSGGLAEARIASMIAGSEHVGEVNGAAAATSNGILSLLPIITTAPSGKTNRIPIIDMAVSPQPTVVAVVSDGADLPADLNEGSVVKGRRRIVNRGNVVIPEM